MSTDLLNKSIKLTDLIDLIVDKESIKSMELNALLNIYLKLRKNELREESISCYKGHLKYIYSYLHFKGVVETKDITQDIIDGYVTYLIAKGNKPITINKRIAILNTMLNYMYDKGFISSPNFKYKKLKAQNAKIKIVDKNDIQLILDHLPDFPIKHQLVFLLLLYTGIRRNELANIKVANIDFDEQTIYLDFTKSGVPRYCYFNDMISKLMKKVISNNSNDIWLFAKKDTHITNKRVSGMLLEIQKKLNIKVLSSHKIRHFYATELLNNGANIITVKELLGHTELEMTKRYLDFTNKQIQKNNDKYNPLNNFKISSMSENTPDSKIK